MAESTASTAGHVHHDPNLQHHFYDMDQQLEASTLGMWVFLVTEIMFFGGLFMAYILYRYWYPGDWIAASNHLNVWMGGGNTLVLICSSVTMAWRGKFGPDYYGPVEVSGLYWHFVDIVWIFLFPLLYLLGAHFGGHAG